MTLNDLVWEIMPKIRVQNEIEFRTCFDSVENTFTALARDYILSQLMYRAYTQDIEVTPAYLEKYKQYSIDKTYRKVVYNARGQQQRNLKRATDINNNGLLSVDGRSVSSLETILAQYKGRYVLIDFWASWCAPCKKEIPYLKQLSQQYSSNKIVFLSVSLDKEVQVWQKAVIANGDAKSNHYLLINSENSSLVKQFDIHAIPRYLLFDKEGKIINAEAPRPSEPELISLLNKLIFE